MQKRKFDELISHFNRKVSDMSIDQKYKMELLGMISAIGFAHEEELSTNLAEVGTDCISRKAAIDAMAELQGRASTKAELTGISKAWKKIKKLPSAQPEIIQCKDCKHWMPYEWMFSEVWQSQNIDDYPEDEISCNYCDVHMKSSDFCSRGERREDG